MPYNGMKDSLFFTISMDFQQWFPVVSSALLSMVSHQHPFLCTRLCWIHGSCFYVLQELYLKRKTPFQNITPGNPLHWPVSRLCLKSPMYQLL